MPTSSLINILTSQRESGFHRYGMPGRRYQTKEELAHRLPPQMDPAGLDLIWRFCEALDLDHPGKGNDVLLVQVVKKGAPGPIWDVELLPAAYLLLAERTGFYIPKSVTVDISSENQERWNATATAWTTLAGHPVEVSAQVWYNDVYVRADPGASPTPTASWEMRPRDLLANVAQVRVAKVACGALLDQVPCGHLQDHYTEDHLYQERLAFVTQRIATEAENLMDFSPETIRRNTIKR